MAVARRDIAFLRHSVGVVTDDGHHGEGEHGKGDMAVPAMPRAGLVVIETELVLGGFEAILDGEVLQLLGNLMGCILAEESQTLAGCPAGISMETPREKSTRIDAHPPIAFGSD